MWYFKFALICSIMGPCAELTGSGKGPKYETEEECLQAQEDIKAYFEAVTAQRFGVMAPAVVHDFVCEQEGDPV